MNTQYTVIPATPGYRKAFGACRNSKSASDLIIEPVILWAVPQRPSANSERQPLVPITASGWPYLDELWAVISPDGELIAFSDNGDLSSLNLDVFAKNCAIIEKERYDEECARRPAIAA